MRCASASTRLHSSRAGRRPASRQPSESTPTSRPWATSGTSVALRPSTEPSPASSRKIGWSACIARATSGSPSMASIRRRPSGARASAPARRRCPVRSRTSSAHESAIRATSSSATSCSASSLACERSSSGAGVGQQPHAGVRGLARAARGLLDLEHALQLALLGHAVGDVARDDRHARVGRPAQAPAGGLDRDARAVGALDLGAERLGRLATLAHARQATRRWVRCARPDPPNCVLYCRTGGACEAGAAATPRGRRRMSWSPDHSRRSTTSTAMTQRRRPSSSAAGGDHLS